MFVYGPGMRPEERKVKQQAGMEKWAKLKLPQLKEECEKRGLGKSGLKRWLVEMLAEDDVEREDSEKRALEGGIWREMM